MAQGYCMRIIDIQQIALQSLDEINNFLNDNRDFKMETDVPELDPAEECSFAIVVSIAVYYNGDEPIFKPDEPVFRYEVLLDRDPQGVLHVFCMDMTVRDDRELTDLDLANRELKNRLTVFELPEVNAEDIVRDFFIKMKASIAWSMVHVFSDN